MDLQPSAKTVFFQYLVARAEASGRGYRKPKNWDKIMKRKDWSLFERLARESQGTMSLVDTGEFFKANFEFRKGRFNPYQFFHKSSFQNYNRWKKLPKKDPDITLVIQSMRFVVDYCKQKGIKPKDYFESRGVYPDFVRYLQNAKLHRFIFTYYVTIVNNFALREIPSDIFEHAMGKDFDKFSADLTIWWMQSLTDPKTHGLIKQFFERLV